VNTSKGILQPLRVRVRRLQFTVGLGFLALVLGGLLSSALMMRLAGRLAVLPDWLNGWLVRPMLLQLWALAVLPVLCYGASRILELSPWRTPLVAALSGQSFVLAILFASEGVDGWVKDGWLKTALDWGMLAAGVVLSQRAILRGRGDAAKQVERAQQQAEARKDEYAEFLQEAERAAEKSAQREAAKAEEPRDEPKAPAA
jgi:hypothetical protein